jgi:hypothetical protein
VRGGVIPHVDGDYSAHSRVAGVDAFHISPSPITTEDTE